MSLEKMAAVGEIWISWFSCCVAQPQKRHRHRIDRSMIGNPMNFQHTAHIGSRDMEMPNDQLNALQLQMRSKGGYEAAYKETDWCR
ncbi:CDC42 small effector protein homolog isoform X2 [Agrilus planipennis]|uniref:CDC42 small effector protein homolog isoform X1 n=1 Tax=Agrilus planipennis TaxID=224129 RepID=A0A7F5RKV2_AGRPL|nr:CDC42 small effector protein homolog isoform X1 [Agrilus planipennis]XP_025836643.1 CDC42 small effector protein homolog isoform X2 [Agrilus planipennis]